MKKNYALIFTTLLCFVWSGYGQGSETFANLNALGGSYGSGFYTGDNGITWTYNGARTVTTTYNITGTTIGFGTTATGTRNVSGTSDANGVGDLTYSVSRYFTGGTALDRSVEVYVNGTLYDNYTLAAEGPIYTRTLTANEGGSVLIEFISTGSRQIVIDDISWTSFSACTPPIDPTGSITGVTPACTSTTLTYTGATIPGTVDYWQTTATGTSTANNATGTFNATTTGTYYVRTFLTATSCWSAGAESYPVTINSAPIISSQPISVSHLIPNTASFSVTAIGSPAPTYQWQVSTNGGGTWANVAGGTGATTNSYATGATSAPMNGNQYRCVVNNTCGSVNSNAATLTLTSPADVVITEIMYDTVGTDDEWIEICNISGSAQTLNDYTIEVDGTTEFTFPASGVIIANGSCITVLLGDNGTAPFNPSCPFTPDYSNGSGTNTLANTTRTITIIADNGSTVIDSVTYDNVDGADGNEATLHVTNALLDNSTTGTNWQEVVNGGSPGINQTTPVCLIPDINVEGNIGTFPDIAGDGSNVPVGFNNTLFAATPIGIGTPPTKSFRIQNTGGEILNISAITLSGVNPGDFSLSTIPTSVAPGAFETFEITFNPTNTGARTAIVTIDSDDPDALENPFDFNIRGTGICTSATINVSGFAPLDGPVGTEVTITGFGFSATSVVTIGGLNAPIVSATTTELVVEIPAITNSGPFTITEGSCFTISSDFILTSDNSNCGLTELIMSEIFDEDGGSLGYIEVYNGTGNTIDLSNYYVRRYGDAQDLTGNIYVDYYFSNTQIFINDGEVLVGRISTDPNLITADFDLINVGGFAGINGEDIFHLYNETTLIDVYTVPNSGIGYTATRNTNTLGPNTTDNPSDWTHNDLETTANLGTFNYVQVVDRPVVLGPTDFTACGSDFAEFIVNTTPGNIGNTLTYQWYYNEGNATDLDWEVVSAGAFSLASVSGINGATLTINDAFYAYAGYQFYCLVTEDGACGIVSDAAKLDITTTTWTLSNIWSNGIPNTSTIAIIDGTYDTSIANLDACQLIINSGVGRTLNVTNASYVRVVNDVVNNGTITVETQGAFVQDGDGSNAGTFTNNGIARVTKETTIFWDDGYNFHYTYWSSPVVNADIVTVFPNPRGDRRFYFDSAQYIDIDGDDISDTPTDWQVAAGSMEVGRGYAVTATTPVGFPYSNTNQFTGAYNTGDIVKSIVINGYTGDNDWNFIGNPYPSAIDFNALYGFGSNATAMEGAAFLWSQSLPPEIVNPGYNVFNFNQSDYAVISAGSGNIAGGAIGTPPNDFIPSGQGFFVRGLANSAITFNNSMRMRDVSSNNQFYRTMEDSETLIDEPNRLWINLTSNNGVFSQLLVAYVNGATNAKDNWSYDVPRNMSTGLYSTFYSLIDNEDEKLAIQGRFPESLTLNETIKIGFNTTIAVPTLYKFSIAQVEGEFMNDNTIYVKDNLMNITHNLSSSDYTFTSETGEFNDRFEIVFQSESLSVIENEIASNGLSITELGDGSVKFSVGNGLMIKHVDIIDTLGRTIYKLNANSNVEVYDLTRLRQAAYIARVTLSNGQTITKKAVKTK